MVLSNPDKAVPICGPQPLVQELVKVLPDTRAVDVIEMTAGAVDAQLADINDLYPR